MSDFPKELSELRKEVVESRNQSIKTDNQIKNLALDIKGFEQRFDLLDKKARYSSFGVYLIIAATVAIAGYLISSVSIQASKEASAKAVDEAARLKQELTVQETKLQNERKQLADEKAARESVGSSALAFVEARNADDDDAAEAAVLKINLDELTSLEVAMLKTDLETFRDDRANEHYRVARDMLARTRRPDAVKSFESALSMSGDFRYSDSARYLLGTTLRELGEYDRAIAVFREIEELERDTNVLAEVRYWLAYSLVRAGQKDQGTALFNQIVDGGGRHASSARRELSALEPADEDASAN
ncbi:MAG: tetratricopeptide repeat protein [Myxococcota bacterium]|nr:tetratricopeptide repeat protein [Myxococcota bacterium]